MVSLKNSIRSLKLAKYMYITRREGKGALKQDWPKNVIRKIFMFISKVTFHCEGKFETACSKYLLQPLCFKYLLSGTRISPIPGSDTAEAIIPYLKREGMSTKFIENIL